MLRGRRWEYIHHNQASCIPAPCSCTCLFTLSMCISYRFRRALAENPAAPAEMRLGLAACYFQLGDVAQATAAFERCLVLDPDCPGALAGLALIKFNAQANVQQVGGRTGSRWEAGRGEGGRG